MKISKESSPIDIITAVKEHKLRMEQFMSESKNLQAVCTALAEKNGWESVSYGTPVYQLTQPYNTSYDCIEKLQEFLTKEATSDDKFYARNPFFKSLAINEITDIEIITADHPDRRYMSKTFISSAGKRNGDNIYKVCYHQPEYGNTYINTSFVALNKRNGKLLSFSNSRPIVLSPEHMRMLEKRFHDWLAARRAHIKENLALYLVSNVIRERKQAEQIAKEDGIG